MRCHNGGCLSTLCIAVFGVIFGALMLAKLLSCCIWLLPLIVLAIIALPVCSLCD